MSGSLQEPSSVVVAALTGGWLQRGDGLGFVPLVEPNSPAADTAAAMRALVKERLESLTSKEERDARTPHR